MKKNSPLSTKNQSLSPTSLPSDKGDDDMGEYSFVIKNLDTGEEIDARDESHVEVMLSQFTTSVIQTPNTQTSRWKDFWDKAKQTNEKLWDAAELGKIEAIKELLADQIKLQNDYKEIQKEETKYQSNDPSKDQLLVNVSSFTGNEGYPSPSPIKQQQSIQEDEQKEVLLDLNSKSLDGWTALHFAVNEGHIEIVKILLDAKANPNLTTSLKRQPLHIACIRNFLEIVKILVANPQVNINATDAEFNTPLHIAAEQGYLSLAEFLLEKGADPNLRNYQQKIPYDYTLYTDMRALLKKRMDLEDYDPQKVYQRCEMNGVIMRNSRSDHVERLLMVKQNSRGPLQQLRKNENQKKVHKFLHLQKIQISMKETITHNDFKWHKLLGKGSFGEVYLASRKSDNQMFAIKVLNKEKVFAKNLTRYAQTEKNVLSVMDHPFIVRLHAAFQNQAKLFLVLDFCPGGDLGNMLCKFTRFSEEISRFYICEVILALESLHQNCIVFRDLKPDNVVIDTRGHARLTDFGLAKEGINNNITKSFCGSIAYLAPEVLLKRGHTRTVDWYLVGVLLYELIVGVPPYYNPNRDILFENIKRGPLKIPKNMSEDAKELIKGLLIRDPTARLGAKGDGAEIKEHPFFKDVNWDEIASKRKDGPYVEKDKSDKFLKESVEVNFTDIAPEFYNRSKLKDWSFVNFDQSQK